jgi:aminoglycoside phosphotransferase (APT) family kinase protein
MGWLRANVPPEDGSPAVTAVVHGDFRLDNMVFDSQMQVGGRVGGWVGGLHFRRI